MVRQQFLASNLMSYQSTSADYKLLGVIKGVNLATAAPTDLGTISIGAQSYLVDKMLVVVTSAAGTLAATTIGLFSAAGGGGVTLVAATALTGLTGNSIAQSLPATATSVLTSSSLFVRSTVASLSAGTADIYLLGYVFQS